MAQLAACAESNATSCEPSAEAGLAMHVLTLGPSHMHAPARACCMLLFFGPRKMKCPNQCPKSKTIKNPAAALMNPSGKNLLKSCWQKGRGLHTSSPVVVSPCRRGRLCHCRCQQKSMNVVGQAMVWIPSMRLEDIAVPREEHA